MDLYDGDIGFGDIEGDCNIDGGGETAYGGGEGDGRAERESSKEMSRSRVVEAKGRD